MALKFFQRINISHKLLAISLAFSLPIAVLLYLAVTSINANIRFASLEVMGNQYQRPLEKLLDHVGKHQLLARHTKEGDSGLDGELRSEATSIDDSFQALELIDREIGVDLQFTDLDP